MSSSASYDDLTDAQLLRVSQSDSDAFITLYDRWARPLLAYFMRRVRDPEIAADLTAETLALVFEKRSRFRDTGAPAKAWLYTIAGHQLTRFARRRKVELRAFDKLCLNRPELDQASIDAMERLIDQDPAEFMNLDRALEAVPDAERQAVELRVVEELSYRDIADRMGCSVVAARVRVHRGLQRLNRLMEVPT